MTSEPKNTSTEFLSAAESLIENFKDYAQAEVIPIIAARYAKIGLVDHAIDLAETISDPFARDNTLGEIAVASISTGTSDYLNSLLEIIEDPGIRSVAIEEIAVKYAELGDFDTALELTRELDDADPAIRRIALVQPTFSARAEEYADTITTPELRSSTLAQLASLAHRDGLTSDAEELLEKSLQVAAEIEFPENQIFALTSIAFFFEEVGNRDSAIDLLSEALELCQDFEGDTANFPRGEILSQIVESFARLNNFELADRAAEQIDDPFQFAHASSKEAIEYFKAGQTDQALTLLSEALDLVLDEPAYGEQGVAIKDAVLAELAVSFAIAGRLEKSLEITKKLSSESQRNLAVEKVGKQCARSDDAQRVFDVAQALTNNSAKATYWLAVTDVLRESSDAELVSRATVKAAESASAIDDGYEKAESLIEAAYRFAIQDNPGKASELFKLSLSATAELGQFEKKTLVLLRCDQRFRELNRIPNEDERILLKQIAPQL